MEGIKLCTFWLKPPSLSHGTLKISIINNKQENAGISDHAPSQPQGLFSFMIHMDRCNYNKAHKSYSERLHEQNHFWPVILVLTSFLTSHSRLDINRFEAPEFVIQLMQQPQLSDEISEQSSFCQMRFQKENNLFRITHGSGIAGKSTITRKISISWLILVWSRSQEPPTPPWYLSIITCAIFINILHTHEVLTP